MNAVFIRVINSCDAGILIYNTNMKYFLSSLCLLAVLSCAVQPFCYAEEEQSDHTELESSQVEIVDPVSNQNSYSAVLYNNTNGLPTSESNDIVETKDGFIWIGSYSGLIRYDGANFERMDSTGGIANVISLYVDDSDRLWVGTNDSGIAVMEDNGKFRMWDTSDGLQSDKICSISGDENGLIYIGTPYGMSIIDQDMNLSVMDEPRLEGVYVDKLRRGCDGTIYGLSSNDDLFIVKDGKLKFYLEQKDNVITGTVCILPDMDHPGFLYLANDDSSLYYGNPERGFSVLKKTDISPLSEVGDIQKFGDKLWICGRNGIGVLDGNHFTMFNDLPLNNSVNHVISDYEGNLWFVSSRQGVMKIVPNRFMDLFERCNLPPAVVNTTCLHEGNLFVGTDTGLIVIDEENRETVTSIPLESAVSASGETFNDTDLISLLKGCRIRSITHDSQGRLWIATWRGLGLICLDHGNAVLFNESDGLLSDHVRNVAERKDGTIMASVTGGVSVLKDGKVIRNYGLEDGILNSETLTVSCAPNGDFLAGSNGGGIYVINEEGVRAIGKADGLTSGIVMRVKYDEMNHVFWIVTSNSLAYMTEDYKVTTIKNFPYSNNYDVYINKHNDAWIIASNGLYVTPVSELLANEEITPVYYSLANGLTCTGTANSYNELDEEGNLYISGTMGVVKVDIDEPMEDVSKLKSSVPYIDADGVRIYPDENGEFHLGWDVQKVIVYFNVFNYSLTDPVVSYCLEGFEKEPVDVSYKELAPITYTKLPGGKYKFAVTIHDSTGYSSSSIKVPIIKQKTIFEYGWFYLMAFVLSAAALTGFVWIYIDQKTEAMEKKQAEAVEKERLNTELQTASRIQNSMMPHIFPPFPDRDEFDIYAVMKPAREVGGDFYDFFMIDSDHLCMVMADVSGKGIPAALFMMVSKAIVKNSAMLINSPSEVLAKTNAIICSDNTVDMFVTIWLGVLEVSTGRVIAANAGHEYPAVMTNGRFELMKDKHGMVVGAMEEAVYKDYEFTMKPGDKLFVYTDGVPEATDAEKKMFGTGRMIEALNTDPAAEPHKILENVQLAVNDFVKDAEQFDDLTMLCFAYKGKQPASAD